MEDSSSKKTSLLKNFDELLVWQKSHSLALKIYTLTTKFENAHLEAEFRNTALAIPIHIAEGFNRRGNSDALKCYARAESALWKLNYLIILTKDLKLINEKLFSELNGNIDECSKLLHGWTRAIKNKTKA